MDKIRNVSIVGASETTFGNLDKTYRELISEAGHKAIEDADIDKGEIESLYFGSYSPERFVHQGHTASLASLSMGMKHVPTTRIENACSSGGAAFKEAYIAVASGKYDLALVLGAEKMTEVDTGEATEILSMAGDDKHEGKLGMTFPGLFALMAQAYKKEYGFSNSDFRDILSSISKKNHLNGFHNDKAHFNTKMSIEEANNSKMIANPLRLADCSPITDGAAALVLAPSDKAEEYSDEPIDIEGFGHATDLLPIHLREDLSESKATIQAAEKAYDMADVAPQEIDFAEVHDCFTINEILAIEGLGLFASGEAAEASQRGETDLGGKIPINPSGGLKAKGHPVGATGIGQIVEVVKQFRGEAEKERQVDSPDFGLTHNIGGPAVSCFVNIFSRG